MRRFLYVTPFFPPLSRVGALDPLKMARALPGYGWEPVVLSDLWPGAAIDPDLLNAVPANLIVHREFSGRTADMSTRAEAPPRQNKGPIARFVGESILRRQWLPMGEAGRYMSHARKRAAELIRQYTCDAVVAHATPVAALPVGRHAALQAGLPLICVLGDPWGPCELRRPMRPFYTRMIEDHFERRVVEDSTRVVLFTEQARKDYIQFFPEIPAERFAAIDNGPDAAIFTESWSGSFTRPTLLFFGGFSSNIRPTAIVRLLAELKKRGGLPAETACASTTAFPEADLRLARRLGVMDRIDVIPRASYRQALSVMAAADILVAINVTPQRVPAKLYDYLVSDRPVLVFCPPHPQLDAILRCTGAGVRIAPEDIVKAADFVAESLQNGRHPRRVRNARELRAFGIDSAARTLAGMLDAASAKQKTSRRAGRLVGA